MRNIDLELIWIALEFYRSEVIPEGDTEHDAIWNDICTNMEWIREELS